MRGIPMKYKFFDKKSEILYNQLLNNDKKGNFENYFKMLEKQEEFFTSNSIPDNCFLSLSAFQAIEFYLKYDKKQIKKIFGKFSKLAANNDKGKYKKLITQTNKIINEMFVNKYTISSNTMPDFEFEINQTVIKSIKVFLDVIGMGIYRIGYNIYLQDEYYYKYWQITACNSDDFLEIRKVPFINRGKIILHNGNNRKTQELIKFQKEIKDNIYSVIRNIAPGLFISLYKSIPIIMVIDIDTLSYYTNIKTFLFKFNNHENDLNNAFWEILRKDEINGFRDFYYNRTYYDTYIPSVIDDYSNPVIFSKHIRNHNAFTPTNLLFVLEILNIFYKNQLNTTNSLKNNYLFSAIKSKLFFLTQSRKELYKTDALIKLLNGSYDIEKRKFENPYNEQLKYYLNNSHEHEIEYFDLLTNIISSNSKNIEENMPELKDIYDKIQNDKNILSNSIFQIIGLVLAIFMALQTIQQCKASNFTENKEYNKHVDYNPDIITIKK